MIQRNSSAGNRDMTEGGDKGASDHVKLMNLASRIREHVP
jgi:hypothetical protein